MNMEINKFGVCNLRTNYMENPSAVDTKNLHFNWQVYSGVRGMFQTAFRIKVYSVKNLVFKGEADIWDSGIVASKDCRIIIPEGITLKSDTRYWWEVEVWDNKGSAGRRSEPASFDIGLFLNDWKALWIWKPGDIIKNDFVYMRKEFIVPEKLEFAKIFVSAHNHYHLYINGIRIDEHVSPVPSDPEKSKYYNAYDIKDILHEGNNNIGAVVHFLGGDGQNYLNGLPGFIAQLELHCENGRQQTINTDETWKCLCNTPYANGTDYQQDRRLSAIEEYNAKLEPAGWTHPAYNDSSWTCAVPSQINDMHWILKPQTIPGGIEEAAVHPVSSVFKNNVQVFDAGKIITGWPHLSVKGARGAEITVRYSENLDNSGRVGRNVANQSSENYYDRYIVKGEDIEEWQPDFSYKAFRFFEVEGYPYCLNTKNIKAVNVYTGLDYNGYFRCSDTLLNAIYDACIQTQKNNMLGQLVDCPHREQAQYLADSDLQAETLLYNFDAHNLLEKVLSDFTDSQLQDGRFPWVFPCNLKHPDFPYMIPEWDLHFCLLMWKIYYFYDDKAILQKYYPVAFNNLRHYLENIDGETGLIRKTADWHISDWPYPNIDNSGECLTIQNCLIYRCMVILSEVALLLDMKEDSQEFIEDARELKKSILMHLYDRDRKALRDSKGSMCFSQGSSVVGVMYGIIPEEDLEKGLDYIISLGHECSTVLSLDLLRVLFDNGREKDAYSILSKTGPHGWGYMIGKGSRTIWEGFDDIESHCHAWNAYPARLLTEYIVGVRASRPGFESIDIKPYMADGLSIAEAAVTAIIGRIWVRWERKNTGYKLEICIPTQSNGNLYLPKVKYTELTVSESGMQVYINGKTPYDGPEIMYSHDAGDYLVFKVQSGNYAFEVFGS